MPMLELLPWLRWPRIILLSRCLTICLLLLSFGISFAEDNPKPTYAFEKSMDAWREGDPKGAVAQFINTDWSRFKTLFKPGSVLNLSESEFRALPQADRDAKQGYLNTEMRVVKEIAAAVAKVGREAAAQGNPSHARKCFKALKTCGEAMNTSAHLTLVQMVGRGFTKLSETESSKAGL